MRAAARFRLNFSILQLSCWVSEQKLAGLRNSSTNSFSHDVSLVLWRLDAIRQLETAKRHHAYLVEMDCWVNFRTYCMTWPMAYASRSAPRPLKDPRGAARSAWEFHGVSLRQVTVFHHALKLYQDSQKIVISGLISQNQNVANLARAWVLEVHVTSWSCVTVRPWTAGYVTRRLLERPCLRLA